MATIITRRNMEIPLECFVVQPKGYEWVLSLKKLGELIATKLGWLLTKIHSAIGKAGIEDLFHNIDTTTQSCRIRSPISCGQND